MLRRPQNFAKSQTYFDRSEYFWNFTFVDLELVVGSGEQDINMNIQSWFLKDAISCKQQIVEKYPKL